MQEGGTAYAKSQRTQMLNVLSQEFFILAPDLQKRFRIVGHRMRSKYRTGCK
jgi:hypothetical protein